jgi:hypothetical protein
MRKRHLYSHRFNVKRFFLDLIYKYIKKSNQENSSRTSTRRWPKLHDHAREKEERRQTLSV